MKISVMICGGTINPHPILFCLVLALVGGRVNADASCGAGMFRCDDGQCTKLEYRCNNMEGGCRDGSDEGPHCPDCKHHSHKCNNDQCVAKDKWCNGFPDCSDGSDEAYCKNCIQNPCLNGGTCMVYKCRCPYPWAGSNCQFLARNGLVWGDPHYHTFDAAVIHFQGRYKYTVAQPRPNSGLPQFKVLMKNALCRPPAYTCVTYVEIHLFGYRVVLERDAVVKVNGRKVYPDVNYGYFSVMRNGLYTRVETDSRRTGMMLAVEFNGQYEARIAVSSNYWGVMEGMLGNADGNSYNDYVTRWGQNVFSLPYRDNIIGNSWFAGFYRRKRDDSESTNATAWPVCRTDTRHIVDDYCGDYLLDSEGPFGICIGSGLVNTTTYMTSCEYDVCAAQDDLEAAQMVACAVLMAFATECIAKDQPPVEWRTITHCDANCPEGLIYKSNTNACPANCGNPNSEEECHLPNTEACVCPEGKVRLDQTNCILVDDCPPPKKTACIAVAVDVSESIEESATKEQEAEVLKALWAELTGAHHLDIYHLVVTLLPFRDGVVTDEVKVVKTDQYSTNEEFIEEEEANMEAIQQDIRTKDTSGLTDLAAVFNYATNTIQCDGAIKMLVVISDFIATLNKDQIDHALHDAYEADYKIIAVGLDTERSEPVFEKVKAASGLFVDLVEGTLADGRLKGAIDTAFGIGAP